MSDASIERTLGRIEALLETNHEMAKSGLEGVHARVGRIEKVMGERFDSHEQSTQEKLDSIRETVTVVDKKVNNEVATRTALENKSKGFVAGAALILPAVGAGLALVGNKLLALIGW